MRLMPVPDESGKPTIWINTDHLVSAQPFPRTLAEGSVELVAELKVEGMPLFRVTVGVYLDREDAHRAFLEFIASLEAG